MTTALEVRDPVSDAADALLADRMKKAEEYLVEQPIHTMYAMTEELVENNELSEQGLLTLGKQIQKVHKINTHFQKLALAYREAMEAQIARADSKDRVMSNLADLLENTREILGAEREKIRLARVRNNNMLKLMRCENPKLSNILNRQGDRRSKRALSLLKDKASICKSIVKAAPKRVTLELDENELRMLVLVLNN